MVLVGDFLSSLIIEEGKNAFLSAVDRLHTQYKSKKEWKRLFVDTGEFFIDHEKNADKIFDDLALVLSKTNMEKLAKEFDKESGYDLKERLLNSLVFLMKQYDIPRDIAYSYSYQILIAIINEMQRIDLRNMTNSIMLNGESKNKRHLQKLTNALKKFVLKLSNLNL